MKKLSIIKIAAILIGLLTLAGCAAQPQDNHNVIQQPEKTIVVIPSEKPSENTAEPQEPFVAVDKIDKFEGTVITDWADEQQVVLTKEAPELGKMELAEFSQQYPKSIYLYDLDTKEYKPLVLRKDIRIYAEKVSPDKKTLLYVGYTRDDFSYYLTSMEDTDQPVNLGTLGLFYGAEWFGADTVSIIGITLSPTGARGTLGVHTVDTTGKITLIPGTEKLELNEAQKMKDKLVYTAHPSYHLSTMDLTSGETKELDAGDVFGILVSPDENQILITQHTGGKQRLSLVDSDGNIVKMIAEGADIQGVSWSPDQRMIAYELQDIVDGALAGGLYVYDVVSGQSVQLLADVKWGITSWSPSGKKIAVVDGSGSGSSMIVYLK